MSTPLTLMAYLHDKYLNRPRDARDMESLDARRLAGIQDFVEFSENFLAANPTVRTVPMHEGLGFALADNTIVSLVKQPEVQGDMQNTLSIPIA